MKTIYRGYAQRLTRTFYKDNVVTDLDALTVTIKKEDGTTLITTGEGTFDELNILTQKVTTGIYFTKITPDAAEALGVYLVYWRATYGTGGAAETFLEGPDVIVIRAEDEIPSISDNYVSLDKAIELYPKIFDLRPPADVLRIGGQASRILDGELDGRFNVPLTKRRDSGAYDEILVETAALGAIAKILKEVGYKEEAESFKADYDAHVAGINNGRWRLWEEITADEIGFSSPRPATSNAGTSIELELSQEAYYTGVYHRLYVIQIDKAGDVGTATFKISHDGGKTWDLTDQATADTWIAPSGEEGMTFRFFRRGSSGNLAVADKWEVEAWPIETKQTTTRGNIQTGKVVL